MLPTAQPLGDTGVMLTFADTIDPDVFGHILALDKALAAAPPPGMRETVPAYVTLLIVYDPLVTDAAAITAEAMRRAATCGSAPPPGRDHLIPMHHGPDDAPDLAEAAARLGITQAALLATHFETEYRVYMYGFAPGYAYMDGVPPALQLPRKPVPVRSRPVGTVMIAGGQCLITTLPMPTGWWVIGRTPVPILRLDDPQPFLFAPGDRVRFTKIAAGTQ